MKGTATMPTQGLSAGTRQCACGGWTRFIVCQYCGTTDPAFAAAGMVSITPLVVPSRDADPQAIPPQSTPPATAPVPAATSPLPIAAQTVTHDGDYAGLEAAATRMAEQRASAPPAFSTPPRAPQPPAAPVPDPLMPPATAPLPAPAHGAFSAPATLPAPGAVTQPTPPAPVAAAPAGPAAPVPPTPVPVPAPVGDAGDDQATSAGGRPPWLVPAAAVAVAAVAGAAYLLLGGSSSSDSSAPIPKGHPRASAPAAVGPAAPAAGPAAPGPAAVLTTTAPAGSTAVAPAQVRPVTTLVPGAPALTGRTPAGITALTRYVVRVNGAIEQGNALTFATPAAAAAFAAGPHVRGSGWQASIPTPGLTLWDHGADDNHAVIVAKGTEAYVLTGPSKAAIPSLEAWAQAIAKS